MTSRALSGGGAEAFTYRYGGKLYQYSAASGTVTYSTGGDGQRRKRYDGSVSTWYWWNSGWTVVNESNGKTTLDRTYVGRSLAHVDGTTPSTGTWRYYLHDHLGSTRELRDASKNVVAGYEYTPYGQAYSFTRATSATTRRYTGHDWDDGPDMYYAPYRWYAPSMARWTTRDPLGMVDGPNVYAYVDGSPVVSDDPLGLKTGRPDSVPWPPAPHAGRPSQVPKYGNFCGPRWSAGRWVPKGDPYPTDEEMLACPTKDRTDKCCRRHDKRYINCRADHGGGPGLRECYRDADRQLAGCVLGDTDLDGSFPLGPHGMCYTAGVVVIFCTKGGGIDEDRDSPFPPGSKE